MNFITCSAILYGVISVVLNFKTLIFQYMNKAKINYSNWKNILKQKVYYAKLYTDNGAAILFVSQRGRTFFERSCDLKNALNHSFGVRYSYEWEKEYGDKVEICSRCLFV